MSYLGAGGYEQKRMRKQLCVSIVSFVPLQWTDLYCRLRTPASLKIILLFTQRFRLRTQMNQQSPDI
jgi:hypothetical protein